MKERKYFLGLDTSCYTTSCAIVDESGNIIGEERKLLEVPLGKCGLQQSQMVFQHTRAMADLISKLPRVNLSGIGVSSFPRRQEDSYMPAFLVGRNLGFNMSHFLNIPFFEFSHQENHILAALRSIGGTPQESFLSLHLSGGTTELLYCEPSENLFNIKIIGESQDLNAGQFIDRTGVLLGLNFPAGPELEKLALNQEVIKPLKFSYKDSNMSFAGPCSEIKRRIEKGNYTPELISAQVFDCINKSLLKLLADNFQKYKVKTLIAVGGVMANSILRDSLNKFALENNYNILFANARYSSDNATGNAYGASLLCHD